MSELYVFPSAGDSQPFEFDGTIYIGRSPENDIQLRDITVSHRHLKIIKRDDKNFLMDLHSRNGTYVDGNSINPGIEIELEKGVPIVIGMSVICLGNECLDSVVPFLDSLDFTRGATEKDGLRIQNRTMTDKKNLNLIRKVNSILNESSDINEISKKILDHILSHLNRVDRGAIILLTDDESGALSEVVISKSKRTKDDTGKEYSRPVVDRVIKDKEAVLISNVQDEDEIELSDTLKLSKIESVICVPMISGSKIRGAIYIDSIEKPYSFRKADLSLINELSNLAAIAIEDALSYSKFKNK